MNALYGLQTPYLATVKVRQRIRDFSLLEPELIRAATAASTAQIFLSRIVPREPPTSPLGSYLALKCGRPCRNANVYARAIRPAHFVLRRTLITSWLAACAYIAAG